MPFVVITNRDGLMLRCFVHRQVVPLTCPVLHGLVVTFVWEDECQLFSGIGHESFEFSGLND